MAKNKSVVITIIVLVILLLGAVGFIVFDQYSEWKQQKDSSLFQQGMQTGYEQAIAQLYQGASNCQQVPVTYDNQTINVVALECLEQQ
jgi:hypothetical protein